MLIQESLVVQGYINSLKALWILKQLVASSGVADRNKETARRFFKMYLDNLDQAKKALTAWENALPGKGDREGIMRESVELVDGMIGEMAAVAAELGCSPQ